MRQGEAVGAQLEIAEPGAAIVENAEVRAVALQDQHPSAWIDRHLLRLTDLVARGEREQRHPLFGEDADQVVPRVGDPDLAMFRVEIHRLRSVHRTFVQMRFDQRHGPQRERHQLRGEEDQADEAERDGTVAQLIGLVGLHNRRVLTGRPKRRQESGQGAEASGEIRVGQIARQAQCAVSRDRVRAPEIAVEHADLPAPPGVLAERQARNLRRIAVRGQGLGDLRESNPAFDAPRQPHLEPVGAPAHDLYGLAATLRGREFDWGRVLANEYKSPFDWLAERPDRISSVVARVEVRPICGDAKVPEDLERADELIFLDITASHEGRASMLEVIRRTARMASSLPGIG